MRGVPVLKLAVTLFLLAGNFGASMSRAANFVSAAYDARHDELVVTLSYRGTNPDHEFTLEWGECRAMNGNNEIAGRIHDSQWNDRALEPFIKKVHFDLADLRCRPAQVTLFTAPSFRIGVFIPARGGSDHRSLRGPRTDVH